MIPEQSRVEAAANCVWLSMAEVLGNDKINFLHTSDLDIFKNVCKKLTERI